MSAVKQRDQENKGLPDIAPNILLLRRAKMVLCPFPRSHREICTRNRPVSETKFLDDLWQGAPFPPGPFVLLLTMGNAQSEQAKAEFGPRSVPSRAPTTAPMRVPMTVRVVFHEGVNGSAHKSSLILFSLVLVLDLSSVLGSVDVSDIFYFSCLGEGKGESGPTGRGEVSFVLKILGGGGGAGRVSAENLAGGGGLNIFFRVRNAHQVGVYEHLLQVKRRREKRAVASGTDGYA